MRLWEKMLVLTVLCCIGPVPAVRGEDFVNVFMPAEAKSLGGCFASRGQAVSGLWLNPALISHAVNMQYSITGSRGLGDIYLLMGSVAMPFPFGNLGVGAGWYGSDPVFYENEEGERDGEKLEFKNYAVHIGYGRRFFSIPLGVNLKLIKSYLGLDHQVLVLADIGAFYAVSPFDFGLTLRNIGISSYDEGNWGEIRAGTTWHAFELKNAVFNLSMDAAYLYEKEFRIYSGLNVRLYRLVDIDLGFAPMELNRLYFGTGLSFQLFQLTVDLDYSINPALSGLTTSHIVQISIQKDIRRLAGEGEAHIEKAQSHMKQNNHLKAEQELKEAMDIIPGEKRVYYLLSVVYYKQELYRKSMDVLEKALNIDPRYREALEQKKLLTEKQESQKPIWLKEDQYYAKSSLIFEDFDEDLIVPKFISDEGPFVIEKEGKRKYGKWSVDEEGELKTTIRLPVLSRFEGIQLEMKSKEIKIVKLILVEQHKKAERNWEIDVTGIEEKWKKINIPFRYFRLPKDLEAGMDLAKISSVIFKVEIDDEGWLALDNIAFYK